jgi:hypothetical protein
MLATHQRRVIQLAPPTFAVWVNVVDREIFPRQFAGTRGAHSISCRIPQDPALLWSKTSLRVLFRKEAA